MATSFQDIVGSYLNDPAVMGPSPDPVNNPEQKKAEVAARAEQVKANIRSKAPFQPFYNVAIARNEGIGKSTITNPVQQDLVNLDNWSLFKKYGEATDPLFNQYATGRGSYVADAVAPTTTPGSLDRFTDTIGGVARGLSNSVLGIGALGAGLVSDSAGTEAAKKISDLNSWFDARRSDRATIHAGLFNVRSELQSADSAAQYEEDKARDGEFSATLKRLGRDTGNAVTRIWNDPEMARDTIAQGVGSLMAVGPLTKGLNLIGKAALRGGMRVGAVGVGETAAKIVAAGAEAQTPAIIAAMEAGGSYQQTVQDAYDNLDTRTDLTNDQKMNMANRAALKAAAITAPVAALTGKLVSKFEANPFHVPNIKTAAGNILREAVEEGVQSGTGQFAQNVGIKENIDKTRDLGQGVGEQIGAGIVGAVGSTALAEAPGLTISTAKNAAKAAVTGFQKTLGALDTRSQNILRTAGEASPVSATNMDAAINTVTAAAPETKTNIDTAVANNDKFTPEERQSVVDHIDTVMNFDPAEASTQLPVIANVLSGATDRFDAIRRVTEIAKDPEAKPEDRLAAGLYLSNSLRRNQAMIDNMPEALAKLDDSDPAVQKMNEYQDLLGSLGQHPAIKQAIVDGLQYTNSITPEAVKSPDSAAFKNAIELAAIAPDKTDPEVNKGVLLHSESLTPEQIGYLKAANALHEAEKIQVDGNKKYGLAMGKTRAELVSNQAQHDTRENQDDLHISAVEHMNGVTAALDAGQPELASRRLQHFMNFSQSMQNKIAALNESFLSGEASDKNRTNYQAYNPKRGTFFTSKLGAYADPKTGGAYLHGASRGSITNAQQVSVDAQAVGYLANELAKAYPQLGVKPIELPALHAAVSQTNAREASRDYRIAKRDGKLNEYLGLNEQTSPNKPAQKVLDETKQDNAVEFEKQQIADKINRNSPLAKPVTPDTAVSQDQTSDAKSPSDQSQEEQNPVPDKAAERPSPDQPASVDTVQEANVVQDHPEPLKNEEPSQNAEASDTDLAYPNLLGSKNNIFKQAFKLPEAGSPISRLNGLTKGFDLVRKALSSASNFRELVTGNSGARITTDVAKSYGQYLALADTISENMDARLKASLGVTKKTGTIGEIIKNDDRAARFEELRALNIVDDNLEYNPELKQNAILAALQWLITADQRQKPMDDEDVSKILGIPVTEVTNEQITAFNQGIYLTAAVNDLAGTITRFWGLKSNNEADQGFVRGVPEGVAKELFFAMQDAGLLSINEIKEGEKLYYQTELNTEAKIGEDNYKALMKYPSAIEVASIVEPVEATFIGAPPPDIATHQLRNSLVPLEQQQLDMLEKEQAVKHYMNLPMVEFLNALSEDGAVALFGHGELAEDEYNVNHRQSLESVNLTVRSAYKAIQNTHGEVENYAGANGTEIGETPIHYAYAITSVNRAQVVGKHNPQANKLTREAILPTRSTMNMDELGNYQRFMLGVAQAWGVKVHTQSRAASVEEAENLAYKEFAPAIELLSDWFQKNETQRQIGFSNDEIQTLQDTLGKGGPIAPAAFHAAMEYARLNQTEDRSKFTTSLYVEADGITDGPINSMFHAVAGGFSKKWVQIVRKGGAFFGTPGMTANKSISTVDSTDLYQETTNSLRQQVAQLRHTLNGTEAENQMNTLLRVLDRLSPDIAFNADSGELTIKRGTVKNPLTVTIYGAGAKGIANKIVQSLTKAIYEIESKKVAFLKDNPKGDLAVHLFGDESSSVEEAQKKLAQYHDDISQLLDHVAEKFDNQWVVSENKSAKKNLTRGNKFTLLPDQVANLQKNVLNLFVEPMKNAIEHSIGETKRGTEALRMATQVQSIYLQYNFRRAVEAELDRKAKAVPGFKKSDFLSQKELKAIYDKMKHLAPFVETGTQNLLISGSERNTVENVNFSRSLPQPGHNSGLLATPAFIFGPENSGVSGIPKVIIGTGDGQMMQEYATMPGADPRHLLVFDGAHFALDAMEDQSKLINEAVYRGWMANPFADVARSFDEFVRDADLSNMDDKQRADLSEALLGLGEKDAKPSEIVEHIKALNAEFNTISKEIQIRKNVLAKVQMTVDHMASAEGSYDANPNGESFEGLDDQQIADRLTKIYAEDLAKSQSKITPSENIKPDLQETGKIGARDLLKFVRDLNVPEAQKSLMMEAAKSLARTDWVVTTDAIPGLEALGAADFNTKTIHVPSMTSETMLHEMIHAATLDQVNAYYSNPESLSEDERGAVQRIEALMGEWLANDESLSDLNPRIQMAMRNAQTTVRSYLGNTQNSGVANKANALNEFMAWNLSNQDLINIGKRTKVSKLARIMGEALKALKKLLGYKMRVNDDLYSNLRFNTSVLLQGAHSPASKLGDTILLHAETFGTDDRVQKLGEHFFNKVAIHLGSQPYTGINAGMDAARMKKAGIANQKAINVLNSFDTHGFEDMTMQQKTTFQMIAAAMATDMELNPNSMQRIQALYTHVMKNISPDDFKKGVLNDQADAHQAQEKYNSLAGVYVDETDLQGRSSLLPAFVALAAVNDDFRDVLGKMDLPKTEKLPGVTLDNILTNFATERMDNLDTLMSGEGFNRVSVQDAMDRLTDRVSDIGFNRSEYIDQFVAPVGNGIDKLNDWTASQMQRLSAAGAQKLEGIKQKSNNRFVKVAADFGKIGLSIFNKDVATAEAEGIMSLANAHLKSKTIHEFINELVGRTRENANVYDLIKAVKSAIQSVRQQYREHLPEFLATKFTREVTLDEQAAMHNGIAKTDFASLFSGYSEAQIQEFIIDPAKRTAETTALLNKLNKLAHGPLMVTKAKELAAYLNTGRAPKNLLRNAFAIEKLLGEGVKVSETDTTTRDTIDHLVSLLALEGLNQNEKDTLSSLVQEQKDGVSFMLSYYKGQRNDEIANATSNTALYNHYKGYVPSIQEGKAFGRTLQVANDDQYQRLISLGYTRVADYTGVDAEQSRQSKGYYYSPVSGRSSFKQGIIQTVHNTVNGIDPVTGFSTATATAGRIIDPEVVKRTQKRLSRTNRGNEQLMPIFDEQGELTAYERSLDPDQEIRLGRSTNAMNMLGVWRGRQIEEALAMKYNEILVDHLHDMWAKEEPTRKNEYINVFDVNERKKDPVLNDAVRLIPRDTRAQLKELYGDNEFWVRRDLLNDALGYRSASIGDSWTGISRTSPEFQKQVRIMATNVFGADAYKKLLTAEKVFQNIVTDARVLIVVKSVIVPMANLVANMYQLAGRGVPVMNIIRGMPQKTAEVYSYLSSKQRLLEIEAELRKATTNNEYKLITKLNTEKQVIEDTHKRLSIWPLIEAGEFSSVSDIGIGKEEIDFSNGRLNEYMESAVNKLPDSVRTLGKYAIVAKDTALFKGLQKTVEYGDFLAKAILYDELTKRKGLDSKAALADITEEYVNYDRLAGRTRDTLESMGLTWFWNFKIRSVKVALSMIRSNPVHAFLTGLVPSPPLIGSVGSPLEDNFFSVLWDGRLDNSIGPGQGLHSHLRLNPWINLVS